MEKIKSLIIGVVALLPTLTFAQEAMGGEALSIDSCVSMALRNNREIREASLQAEQYKHTRKSYFANYFPNIKAQALDLQSFAGTRSFDVDLLSFLPDGSGEVVKQLGAMLAQHLSEVFGVPISFDGLGTASFDYKIGNVFSGGISLTQPIYMGGKITAAYKMSKIGEQMAQVNKQLTRDQVILGTHQAYALLLQASELEKVAVQYDSLLCQLMRDVESAKRHGLRSQNDVLKVQVKKSEAELQIVQARNGIRLAQMNLCHYIGLPLGQEVYVQEIETTESKPSDANATVSSRPEYNLLELKSELAAQQVKLTRSEFLPQLGVQAQYGYTHGVQFEGEYLLHRPGGSVIANLTIPIYHANEAYHKVKAAKLEHERAVLEQEDLVEKMNLELQQSANKLDESILEVELTKKNLEQAQENLRSSRKSFDLGLESLSDLLEAQTLWQQAYAKKATADCQLIVNEVNYRKAAGTL